ncbi:MAG: tRNA(Ile)-lysidine synthetase, partial [Leptospira sp.]|nr:tRNA(Ile)-lysidine synthetase [Leptospira sp.]
MPVNNFFRYKFHFQNIYKKKNIPAIAKKTGRGLEETGRIVRYHDLARITRGKKMYAVTGHHSVDYLETILINLIRGGGPESLKTLKIFENNVFRPLIKFKMSEMEEIHAGEKWEVFLDESNDDTKFLRNRIRRNIVPELLKENLSPEKLYDNFHNDEEENSVGSQTETFPFLKIDKQMIINAGAGILKQAIDIFLKRLRKHPIQKKLFMELKLSIDQGKSFTKENKECIFWKSQRSHLYIIPRNSPVL